MMKIFHNSLLIPACMAAMALSSTACGGSNSDDDSTGGSSGTGGTGASTNVVLSIDPTGWMDRMSPPNGDVDVQGAWYPYGDAYDVAKCTNFGNHMASECANITTPNPDDMSFPNEGGKMHTAGTVEKVLPCVAGSMAYMTPTSGCPDNDYSSMWGAGIGFDFNSSGGDPATSTKSPWDPREHGVVGVRFKIDVVPPSGLRVEFPMLLTADEAAADMPVPVTTMPPTTDDHSKGAPYWGAKGDNSWPTSPVKGGGVVNTILFATDVQPAVTGVYMFDQARMLGVQFHVPTTATAGGAYDFTISEMTLVRDPNQP